MNIDNDAKTRVALFEREDEYHNKYYIGKLQFPGTLDLEQGASFMIFNAEKDAEELQISPIDEERRSRRVRRSVGLREDNKLRVDMFASTDSQGRIFYVGEAQAPVSIDLRKGIFLAFFCSKEGKEELQISRLAQKKHHKRYEDEDHENDEGYQQPRLLAGNDDR